MTTIRRNEDAANADPPLRRIRRTALSHAFLLYLFGVVIVAGEVNLISGIIRQAPAPLAPCRDSRNPA